MIDSGLAADLLTLSREIHADPELAYEERRAAERIAILLELIGTPAEERGGGKRPSGATACGRV